MIMLFNKICINFIKWFIHLNNLFFLLFKCLISLSNVQADWTEQECIDQWSRRIKC